MTLAVAGFTDADLSVQIEDRQLVIRGKQEDDQARVYLHRGIAARQFQRSFVLAEGIEVAGATLDNGLLCIELIRPTVEKIGRASSRERVCQYVSISVVAVSLNKKKYRYIQHI